MRTGDWASRSFRSTERKSWESLAGIFSRTGNLPLIGEVFRRTLTADLLGTWIRQRARTSLALTAGAGVEHRSHVATPSNDLLAAIDSSGALGTLVVPESHRGGGLRELSAAAVQHFAGGWRAVERDRSRSVAQRKHRGPARRASAPWERRRCTSHSIFPGFAHHVLALRGAVGYADERSNSYYLVGGVSGSTFEIVPGYVVGEGRKTFPVRGFESGTLAGIRAFSGTAEYRIPLFLIGKSPGILPFFLDRSSLTLFGDFGTAWCPTVRAGREVCNRAGQADRTDIASVGGELNLNLGVLSWDSPYRFRLGVVTPTYDGHFFGRKSFQVYVVAGTWF